MALKRNVLWTGVGLGFALTIGTLAVVRAMEPDPDEIKAEFAKKIAALEALPAEEAVLKDARAEELLAVADYRLHARSLWLKLDRLHSSLHEAATRDRAAQKEVPPYLTRCKDLASLPLKELDLRAGEGRSLLASYAATRFGASLRDALDRIERSREVLKHKLQEDMKRLLQREDVSPAAVIVDVQRRVLQAVKAERFSDALALIDDFDALKLDADYIVKSRELRDSVKRSGRRAAENLLKATQVLEEDGNAGDAVRLLEAALPRYKGIPEAGELEAALRRLKPR